MKTENYIGSFLAWKGLCRWLALASITLIVLSVTSCGSTKKMTESARITIDSVLLKEVRQVINIPIPLSKVELKIPTQSLHSLPPGASFSEKKGQAGVKVTASSDTLYVTASCDSLQVQCERYEKELTRIRSDTDRQVTEIKKNTFQTAFKWCSIGFIAGIVSTLIVIIIFKRKNILWKETNKI